MKIICIAHNYPQARPEPPAGEAGNPVLFMKPDTALLRNNQPLYYPKLTQDLRCEVALVLRVCRLGRGVSERFAHRYYAEVGVGVDFTAGDVLRECRQKGLPWELCKAFDYSAPVSPELVALSALRDASDVRFSLELNGKTVQQGSSRSMVWGFNRLISYVSGYVILRMGDLIFTGSPSESVGVRIGDRLVAKLEEKSMLTVDIR
ncbi:MAG: fumarylacetoacetate hydrolase family protein [Prevotellaceae bacterium]|jgi:2-keto-4-pentenoate hydratase/2-oxohepta-3-ene-1,7-dioic acid hydratase in catechol pathway|nr:fumarylacetoacetate hydrolase family protein [Prevotellaceae bacterium]